MCSPQSPPQRTQRGSFWTLDNLGAAGNSYELRHMIGHTCAIANLTRAQARSRAVQNGYATMAR